MEGTITCDGYGVAGVAVSDGYEIVLTDADGYYAMTSAKRNGYVFFTLPGGYEPEMTDGFKPQFWAPLNSHDTAVHETHNFTLRRVNNDRHIMIFGADSHFNLAVAISDAFPGVHADSIAVSASRRNFDACFCTGGTAAY